MRHKVLSRRDGFAGELMESREALYKIILWRAAISLPASFVVTYIYFGGFYRSIEFIIIINLIMTILHFVYEKLWENLWLLIKHQEK